MSKEAKVRSLLEAYLLGSMVYDEVTLQDIDSAVPPKYKDSPILGKTVQKLRTKRMALRAKVKDNVKKMCSTRLSASQEARAGDQSALQATESLREREAEIDSEMKEILREYKDLKAELQDFEQALDPDSIVKALTHSKLPLDTLKALTQSLNGK